MPEGPPAAPRFTDLRFFPNNFSSNSCCRGGLNWMNAGGMGSCGKAGSALNVSSLPGALISGANCGSCWRSGQAPASGCRFATTVAATCRSSGPNTGCFSGPINFFTHSEEGGLCASNGTRGVGVDDRPSRRDDSLMARNPTEAARSLQPESVPPSMVTNMVR